MSNPQAIVLLASVLPGIGFLGGAGLLWTLAGRPRPPIGETPLYIRWTGYSTSDVARYWGAFGSGNSSLGGERRFLELDLLFPFVYGGTLFASTLMMSAALGRPYPPSLPVLLVALTMFADWTENLIQLRQLRLFSAQGPTGLQDNWCRLASIATIVKLSGACLAYLSLLFMAASYLHGG